jgi:hypothetical protein
MARMVPVPLDIGFLILLHIQALYFRLAFGSFGCSHHRPMVFPFKIESKVVRKTDKLQRIAKPAILCYTGTM